MCSRTVPFSTVARFQGQTRSEGNEHGDSPNHQRCGSNRGGRSATPSRRHTRTPSTTRNSSTTSTRRASRIRTRRMRSGRPSSSVSTCLGRAGRPEGRVQPHKGGGLDAVGDRNLHPGDGSDVLSRPLGLIGGFRSPASALGLYYCSVTGVARRTHEAESRGHRVSWMSRRTKEVLAHRSGVCCDRRYRAVGMLE